jgi:mRNA interferase MazF
MRLIVTYKPFSVVVVPFPFVDQERSKRRPALVLSTIDHQKQTHHITLLMITSAKRSSWPSDYSINNLVSAGLSAPSIIRQKLFTVDISLIIKNIGELSIRQKRNNQ